MYAFSFAYFFRGERDAFIAAAERAVEANPSVPNIIAGVGLNLAYVGQWEKGLKYIQRARQIERDPPGWWYFGEYFDHYRKGEYEAALEQAHKVNLPDYVWANALLAAAYGQLGRVEEAKPYVTRILKLNPDFEKTARQQRYKWFRFQEPLLDQFIDGLRKTGLKIPPNG